MTTEELLRGFREATPSTVPSRIIAAPAAPAEQPAKYRALRAASARHPLRGALLPPEQDLRHLAHGVVAAVVAPPPRLPHQLDPALQAVLLGEQPAWAALISASPPPRPSPTPLCTLLPPSPTRAPCNTYGRWRSVYESCTAPAVLQTLVGECYAPDAVFEDAMVSARGHEAVYRQFAMLGALVRSVQVGAYSLSVAPLPQLHVALPAAAPKQPPEQPPARAEPPQEQPPRAPPRPGAGGARALHVTRITVENVQSFTLAVPALLGWLVGDKRGALQIPLYVTSILLVASDLPLAVGPGAAAGDITATRLAGAAAALGGQPRAAAAPPTGYGGAAPAVPSWCILHHVDAWHNVPTVWWVARRALARALDTLLAPLLGL
ncbi:hypothetical protein TSOC_002084 [Tetrabaena socialis]|uniref:Uncharacterized protein n=1 Tax=Tetrabaena socialis TaxID=47790 RepID=A0A2J8AF35_9CHLO|nr:hypothetical protein TSOC_002084 [Tetrabaena socialis]|eukprot:PNH11120.1 hypothetical protein TSOC_002084 [Tetrabaena socialis]